MNILLLLFILVFGLNLSAGGLDSLQAGVQQGVGKLQSFGLVLSGFMFVAGSIYSKFNSDRGKHLVIWAIIGAIGVMIGPSVPDTLKTMFQ